MAPWAYLYIGLVAGAFVGGVIVDVLWRRYLLRALARKVVLTEMEKIAVLLAIDARVTGIESGLVHAFGFVRDATFSASEKLREKWGFK